MQSNTLSKTEQVNVKGRKKEEVEHKKNTDLEKSTINPLVRPGVMKIRLSINIQVVEWLFPYWE